MPRRDGARHLRVRDDGRSAASTRWSCQSRRPRRSPRARPCSRPRAAGRHRVLPAGGRRSWRHDTAGVRDRPRHTRRVAFGTVVTMPFPKKNLNANETIALDMHPHWWYFAEPALSVLGSIILGIIVLAKTHGDA